MARTMVRCISGLALASALFLISGCTPVALEPEPTPATPTPSASTEAVSMPEPVIDAPCEQLLNPDAVASAFPSGVTAIDPAESLMAVDASIPATYPLRSLGGIACEVNNGESYNSSMGGNAAYIGARVLVLPDAVSQWERFADYYGTDGEVGHYCATESLPLYCTTNELVDTTWVNVTVIGAATSESANALGASAVAAIADAPAGSAPWTIPANTTPLPADCEAIISDSAVQAATGVATPLHSDTGGGGWSIEAAAYENWGGRWCVWKYGNSDLTVGLLATLPGGAWAWQEASEFVSTPSTPGPLAVASLAVGDEAWLRCASDESKCIVDLVVGGNWVQATLSNREASSLGEQYDVRAAAQKVADAIVANIG